MNEIVKAPMPLAYGDLERLAAAVAKSGLFGIRTQDQAIALMMIAHAEGRHPALAARDYDIISGKPAKKAEAMMRDFIQAGGKVEWHELSDKRADATFTHPQTGSVRIDWDVQRATTAGLAGKDNWKKFPRSMLRSRVVSEGVRTIWPLATSGMYVPEELREGEPFNGTTLEADPEPAHIQMGTSAANPVPAQEGTQRAAAAAMPASPRKRQTIAEWLESHRIALADAQSAAEVDRILEAEDMQQARQTFRNGAKQQIEDMISEALAKWYQQPPEEPEAEEELPDLAEIALP